MHFHQQSEKWIIRLRELAPLKSYFRLFNQIWTGPLPRGYVIDMAGIKVLDSDTVSLIVLLRQHATMRSVDFEVINLAPERYRDMQMMLGNS